MSNEIHSTTVKIKLNYSKIVPKASLKIQASPELKKLYHTIRKKCVINLNSKMHNLICPT